MIVPNTAENLEKCKETLSTNGQTQPG